MAPPHTAGVAPHAAAVPLIARGHELATLEQALASAVECRGSAWLVTGEAGVGKTRLLAELRARAAAHGCPVLEGYCFDAGGGFIPYGPFLPAFRDLDVTTDALHADRAELVDLFLGRHPLQALEGGPAAARAAGETPLYGPAGWVRTLETATATPAPAVTGSQSRGWWTTVTREYLVAATPLR